MFRSFAGVALVAGCSGRSASDSPALVPVAVEVRDALGEVTARVLAGRPCRAMVEGIDLQIGAEPLVTMVGLVRWAGVDEDGGTTLTRDGVRAAKIVVDGAKINILDDRGIPVIRLRTEGDTATVLDAANTTVRTAVRSATSIAVGDMTVTGTQDLLLAALLTAHEIGPEVRALAACHRLLLPQKSAP